MTHAPRAKKAVKAKLEEALMRLEEAMNHHATYIDWAVALVRPSDLYLLLESVRVTITVSK